MYLLRTALKEGSIHIFQAAGQAKNKLCLQLWDRLKSLFQS